MNMNMITYTFREEEELIILKDKTQIKFIEFIVDLFLIDIVVEYSTLSEKVITMYFILDYDTISKK